MNRTMKNKKGFTLMEMLIVVAIIAVLVAIAIPVYQGQVHKAKVAADWANVRAYYAELQADYLTTGEYLDIKYMDEYGFDMTQIPAHGNSTNPNSHRPNISSVISGYKQPSKSAQSIEITGFIEKSKPSQIIFLYTLLPLTA